MSATTAQANLDGQYLATHLRPSQACGHTRHGVFHLVFVVVHGHTEHLAQILYGNLFVKGFFADHLFGAVTHHVAYAALQVTHARLTGVVVDDVHHDVLREGDLLIVEAVLLHLLGDEVAFGDFIFLLAKVTAQVYDFHTVAQSGMDGCKVVSRGDKKNLREVIVQLDEVVVESVILLRVKDFKQGSLRVTIDVVTAHFVDFIQNENRVTRLHLTQVLDNTARHGTDIGFTVTT